jgi:uncharacterized protein
MRSILKLVRTNNQLLFFIVILLSVYIIPILLILGNIVGFKYRFLVMLIVALILLLHACLRQIKFRDIGGNFHGFTAAINHIYPVTLGFGFIIILVYIFQGQRLDNSHLNWYFYSFFIIGSVPVQEFIYRGYLFHLCEQVGLSKKMQILTSTILYGFMHIIYWDLPTLLLTLIAGLVWGYHYSQFKNIYSTIASHVFLGVLAIVTGII